MLLVYLVKDEDEVYDDLVRVDDDGVVVDRHDDLAVLVEEASEVEELEVNDKTLALAEYSYMLYQYLFIVYST